jgi:hypothetical protein
LIKLLTQKNSIGLIFSGLIYLSYAYILSDFTGQKLGIMILLYLESVILNYLCFRFGILGQNTALPTLLFSVFSALFIMDLSIDHIGYGAIFLSAFYFIFRAKEIPNFSKTYLIYMGLIIGTSQAFINHSIFLFIPILFLFIQVGIVNTRGFLMALTNLGMTIASAIGLYYLINSPERILEMIPDLSSDIPTNSQALFKITSPIVIFSIIFHISKLNSYSFRFPNLSKNINYTFLVQVLLGFVIAFITKDQNLMIYALMALAILLSFTFVYLQKSVFANALFTSLIATVIASLYICQIIFL